MAARSRGKKRPEDPAICLVECDERAKAPDIEWGGSGYRASMTVGIYVTKLGVTRRPSGRDRTRRSSQCEEIAEREYDESSLWRMRSHCGASVRWTLEVVANLLSFWIIVVRLYSVSSSIVVVLVRRTVEGFHLKRKRHSVTMACHCRLTILNLPEHGHLHLRIL